MHPNANNIQTHQFKWNAWVEWMCKMKCYENLNGEVLGIWETHWNSRTEPFYNGTITCGYEECQGTYTSLLADWTENLNNSVIPEMQAHNFVSSCSVQNNFYVKGSRHYELSNHLGNVLAVVNDRKIESDEDYFYAGLGSGYKYENGVYIADVDGEYKQHSGPDGIISSFSAEVVSANDYYAFGSLMPGRSFSGGEYKFGFNGKENDNEVKGEGGQQDYGLRIYDNRIGKFLSIDPLSGEYPWNSTYAFAENCPIEFVDLDGAEKAYPKTDGTWVTPGDHFYKPIPSQHYKQFNIENRVDQTLENVASGFVVLAPVGLALATVTAEQIVVFGLNTILRYQPMIASGALLANKNRDAIFEVVAGIVGYDGITPSSAGFAVKLSSKIKISEIFIDCYGTVRGLQIEGIASKFRYVGWEWVGNRNFRTFDFISPDRKVYSSLKTWDAQSFNLSSFKNHILAIEKAITNGMVFNKIYHKPKSGILDIVVPENMLKEFTDKGGKYYEQYQELLGFASKQKVKIDVKISSDVD